METWQKVSDNNFAVAQAAADFLIGIRYDHALWSEGKWWACREPRILDKKGIRVSVTIRLNEKFCFVGGFQDKDAEIVIGDLRIESFRPGPLCWFWRIAEDALEFSLYCDDNLRVIHRLVRQT